MTDYDEIIRDMIFLITKDKFTHDFKQVKKIVGTMALRLAVAHLLSWLRTCDKNEPLVMAIDSTVLSTLHHCMNNIPQFHRFLVINHDTVNLLPSISVEIRNEIKTLVINEYNPRVRR